MNERKGKEGEYGVPFGFQRCYHPLTAPGSLMNDIISGRISYMYCNVTGLAF